MITPLKLVVEGRRGNRVYSIAWRSESRWVRLGDKGDEEQECASAAARVLADEEATAECQYLKWTSRRLAQAAMRKAIAALRELDRRRSSYWPSWAVTAKRNGWNPPKDWKP